MSGMDTEHLKTVTAQLLARGKGILAADESTSTIEKRLTAIGITSTEENRRAYRDMLLTTPGLGECISGVILYDETIRQKALDERLFPEVLLSAGVLPGIKVDLGTQDMPGSPEEKVTKGLEGLSDRLKEYRALGAQFAKWRAVITITEGAPTDENITANAHDLAAYARTCQDEGIVPIVEPEVLMDGANTIEVCEEVSRRVLTAVFAALGEADVYIPGMILKTNMVVPGKMSGQDAASELIADATLRVFTGVLPPDLQGQAFLSGGQSDIEATKNLDAMNKKGPHPWALTFSYGRALQDAPLKAWGGKAENKELGQAALMHRARMNSLAAKGEYAGE